MLQSERCLLLSSTVKSLTPRSNPQKGRQRNCSVEGRKPADCKCLWLRVSDGAAAFRDSGISLRVFSLPSRFRPVSWVFHPTNTLSVDETTRAGVRYFSGLVISPASQAPQPTIVRAPSRAGVAVGTTSATSASLPHGTHR